MGAQNNCFLMEQGLASRVGEREAEVLQTPSARRAAALLKEDEAISARAPGSVPMLTSFRGWETLLRCTSLLTATQGGTSVPAGPS